MNKQMLILKGPGNSGKSTSIKLTFDAFLRWTIKKNKNKEATVHFLYLTDREVAAVIEIENKSIGIASRGDSEAEVKRGLAFFDLHQCEVVLCATRSRGKPLAEAQNFSVKLFGARAAEIAKTKSVGSKARKIANTSASKDFVKWLKRACR